MEGHNLGAIDGTQQGIEPAAGLPFSDRHPVAGKKTAETDKREKHELIVGMSDDGESRNPEFCPKRAQGIAATVPGRLVRPTPQPRTGRY